MLLYFLTCVYMLLASAILLFQKYRSALAFIMDLRYPIINYKRVNNTLVLLGLVLASLNLFFPFNPGPVFIGDLSSCVMCVFISIYYFIIARENTNIEKLNTIGVKIGYVILLLTSIHIIYPSCVLL